MKSMKKYAESFSVYSVSEHGLYLWIFACLSLKWESTGLSLFPKILDFADLV